MRRDVVARRKIAIIDSLCASISVNQCEENLHQHALLVHRVLSSGHLLLSPYRSSQPVAGTFEDGRSLVSLPPPAHCSLQTKHGTTTTPTRTTPLYHPSLPSLSFTDLYTIAQSNPQTFRPRQFNMASNGSRRDATPCECKSRRLLE